MAFFQDLQRDLQSTILRRPGISRVVAFEETDVVGPGIALGIRQLRLDSDQNRITFLREYDRIVAPHPPVIRKIKDVVRSTHDQRGYVPIFEQVTEPVSFLAVDW